MDKGSFYKEIAPQTYKIIPFFREYLASRQARYMDAQQVRAIYRNAGHLFESEREYTLAMECYLRCGDIDSLSYVLEQFSRSGVGRGRLWENRRFYRAIPPHVVETSPTLCYAMSLLEEISFHLDAADQWLETLRQMQKTLPLGDPRRQDVANKLATLQLALPHRKQTVRLSTMRQLAKNRETGAIDVEAVAITGNRPSVYNGGLDFSRYAGNVPMAARLFAAVPVLLCGRDGVGAIEVAEAEWLYQQSRLSEALVRIVAIIPRIERDGSSEMLFAATFVQSAILMADGRGDTTQAMLRNLRDRLIEQKADQLIPNMDALLIWLALYQRDYETISAWLENGAPDETGEICTLDRFALMIKVRCYLSLGRNLEAIRLLAQLLPIQISFYREAEQCENKLLMAIAWNREQNQKEAMKCMGESLAIAEKRKLMRTVADEGMEAYKLMRSWQKATGQKNAFLQETMQTAKKMGLNYLDYLCPPNSGTEALTEAELEVLRLLAKNYTNAEICQTLNITINTVKTHTKHIFSKLDVCNRAQAVKMAQENKILK